MVRAQRSEVLRLGINAAGHRGYLVACGFEKLHRDGAHATRGARDEDVALGRAVGAQLIHADGRGVTGRTNRGGVASAETLRHGDGGLTVDALLGGVAAVAEFPQAVTKRGDELALLETIIRGLFHGAHDVNAGNQRVNAHNALIALQSHGVLVVEGGILDVDQCVSFCENWFVLEIMGNARISTGDNKCAHAHYPTCAVKQRFVRK